MAKKRRKYGSDRRYPGVRWYDTKARGRVFYLVWWGTDDRQHEKKVGFEYEGWSAKLIHQNRGRLIQKFENQGTGKGQKRYAFGDAVESLFEVYEREGKKGIRQERSRLKYLSHLFGRPIDQIMSEPVLQGIEQGMKKAGLGPTSIHHTFTLFRRIVYHAAEDETFTFSNIPSRFQKALRERIRKYRPDPRGKVERLTGEELATLIRTLETWPDRLHANIVRLALFSGMRRGNILLLGWPDIDWDRGVITLRAGKTKGKKYDSEIPMNSVTRGVLKEMRALRDKAVTELELLRQKDPAAFLRARRRCFYVVKSASEGPEEINKALKTPVEETASPYVFPGKNGGPRVDVRKGVNKIREAARLPEGFRPLHGLRHTWGTAAAMENAPFIVKDLLTHSDTKTTSRYVDLADKVKQQASDKTAARIMRLAVNGGGNGDE